nr:MAG: Pentaxin family protein [Bacteriophage sp.]
MGTISDKLMRIINTKEDIRQALISKGYDVPTSIPFKEYAKMILDLPCKVDSFPDIEGIVARYSASGLTNEQMAANPVWVDKTGNGHDIQLKNFSWKGMSGVGGYEMNFNLWRNNVSSIPDISMSTTTTSVSVSVGNSTYNNNLIYIHISNWDINKNHWLKVTSTYEDGDLAFIFYNDSNTKKIGLPANGYVNILAYPEFKGSYMYISTISNKQGSFTIEQLPLYPGALVFDGVDDYGVCENFPILTKEKGYTVVVLRQWDQDFLNTTLTGGLLSTRNYSTGEGVAFEKIESSNKGYWNLGAGGIIDFAKSPFTWQTSKQYNNVGILKGDKNHGKPLCVGCGLSGGQQCGRFAIWELVFLDHDATEEELTKIKDYFVKTYPWLFFDQAWTVTGKTNEDEDRATIANITGNGNNLVLSNFGFAEGSGYGLYAENYAGGRWVQSTDRADLTWTSYSVNITSVKVASTQLYYQSYPEQPSFIVPSYKIKVYGLKDGQTLSYRQATSEGQQLYKISEDGTYTLPSFPFKANGDWYGFTLNKVQESCDITIEQIPEYEGYLVTDGVDDKITSSTFEMGNDWTVIGDWELINTGKNDNAGIVKFDSIVIYNYNPILINIKNGRNNLIPDQNTVNAICSDGRIYSKDWKESIYNEETESTSKNFLTIGYSGNVYTKIAFKNLAIYPTVLSREDCIKAYNYLQTLKAK